MTDLQTAAQQALEALEDARTFTGAWPTGSKAVAALRAALAQQAEPVEPVAWVLPDALDWKPRQSETVTKLTRTRQEKYGFTTSLYTAPPQRKLVPLTEEEIDKIFKHLCDTVGASCKTMARAVEKTSWEKNHGQA